MPDSKLYPLSVSVHNGGGQTKYKDGHGVALALPHLRLGPDERLGMLNCEVIVSRLQVFRKGIDLR